MHGNTDEFRFYDKLRGWEEGDILVRTRTKAGKVLFMEIGMKYMMAVLKGKANPVYVKNMLEYEYERWDLV